MNTASVDLTRCVRQACQFRNTLVAENWIVNRITGNMCVEDASMRQIANPRILYFLAHSGPLLRVWMRVIERRLDNINSLP